MFTVGKRIGIGYLLMTLLIAMIGGAGLYSADRISAVLDRVTGPIQATTRAVNNGIRGVQQQMLGVDRALRGQTDEAERQISDGHGLTLASFTSLVEAGLVSMDRLESVREKMVRFDATRENLLSLHSQYRDHQARLLDTLAATKDLLLVIEELSSQALVALEWDAGLAEDEETNARDTEEWAVIGAAADARLALMTRLFDYRQLLDDPDNPDLQAAAAISLGDLLIYLESLAESDLLNGRLVGRGPFGKSTFDATLLRLYAENEAHFTAALETHTALGRLREVYRLEADGLMTDALGIEAESRRIVADELQNAANSRASALWLVAVLVGSGLTVAFAAYLASLRTIATPLRRVARRMHEIASGNGDLTARLDVQGRDEIAEVSGSFNDFAGKIRDTVIQVRDATTQLTGSSERMHALTETAMTRSSRQQAETEQITTATHELSLTASSVAEAAKGASRNADHAKQEADSGRQVVAKTLGAINDLGGQIELAATTIEALERESEKIGIVIDVIGGIAEQTNLLALNAAIEAARAGDQGRGFSVVADEVRTLANRTRESTGEILAMIECLQSQARQAAAAMQQSREMAGETAESGETTGISLEHIVESVNRIQQVNQQIAGAAAEQRSAAEEISRSIERINSEGEDIVAESEEMSESARSLFSVSERLDGLVRQFRT